MWDLCLKMSSRLVRDGIWRFRIVSLDQGLVRRCKFSVWDHSVARKTHLEICSTTGRSGSIDADNLKSVASSHGLMLSAEL
jgi:hypothetical protein